MASARATLIVPVSPPSRRATLGCSRLLLLDLGRVEGGVLVLLVEPRGHLSGPPPLCLSGRAPLPDPQAQ
eukprot:1844436-Pyramimonas_sp.AAC.1